MHVGILGGTGSAGRGLATRLGAAGVPVTLGSRDGARADAVAADLRERWPGRSLPVDGAANEDAACAELVVVATPWEGTVATVTPLAGPLEGKVVVSMVNAMTKAGRELLALVPPRGSMAATVQAALPGSSVAAAFHHLPAADLEDLAVPLDADVLVCGDDAGAAKVTAELVDGIVGLRAILAGSLAQAAAVEAFTAVLVSVNIRHRAHASLRLTGLDHG
jgi:NADPH-dependent F420 reductase